MPIINKQQCKDNLKVTLKANYLASSIQATENNDISITQILKRKNKAEKVPFNFVAFFVPDSTDIFKKSKDKSKIIFSKHSSNNFTTIRFETGKNLFRDCK